MNLETRLSRLEQAADVPGARERAEKRRRVVELIALGSLRLRGETFASFAEVERARGRQSDADLLRIIGMDAEGFDSAMVDFVRAYRRGDYDGLIKPRRPS